MKRVSTDSNIKISLSLKIITKKINTRNLIFGIPVRGPTADRSRLQLCVSAFVKRMNQLPLAAVGLHILNKAENLLAG